MTTRLHLTDTQVRAIVRGIAKREHSTMPDAWRELARTQPEVYREYLARLPDNRARRRAAAKLAS